ncbi:hypothetical protein GQ457_18G006110 [Hibiscus cannabinus]
MRIFRQNNLDELKELWEGLDRESRQIVFSTYGDIAYLLYVPVDESMLQALIQFWNPGYRCFTLNGKDLMPTVEEYTELLRVPNTKGDRVYTKPERGTNFGVCLKDFAGRSIQWATDLIKKKGGSSGFSWSWIAEITRTYPDPHKKAQLLTVAIYGFVIFPRILDYIDVAILDLFNQLEHGINLVHAILAETFISLNACRELEGGRFMGCAPLLMVWIKSHFWKTPKTVLPGIGSMYFSPLKEFLAEQWDEWTQVNGLRPSGICKSKTLFGGPHGYALGVFCIGAMNTTGSCYEGCGEESIALLFWFQDSSYRLHNRQEIQQAEDRQKSRTEREIEKERKRNHDLMESEKSKGKQTIEQYQQALKAEKENTVAWKRKSHDSKIRLTESQNAYNALEIQLNQSRAQYIQLEARLKEQEDMIREYQTRDEYTELQASMNKIETLEKEVKDLWEMVQTCQITIQVLEDIKKGGNDYWFTRLRDAAHRFQEQDKINEKIMNLTQDVAEHVTALAREARILRPHVVSNEMKSSLELLFDQIEDLETRVKLYLPRD